MIKHTHLFFGLSRCRTRVPGLPSTRCSGRSFVVFNVRQVNQVAPKDRPHQDDPIERKSINLKVKDDEIDRFVNDQGCNVSHQIFSNSEERLVYVGNLEPQVKRVKIFSLTTSTLGLICQPVILNKTLDSSTSKIAMVFVGWTCLAVICSPLLLNLVTKRYITRLTFNQHTGVFTASTLNFLNRHKQLTFNRDDVHVPAIPGMFTSFIVKGQPLLLDPSLVTDKQAYMHMMGYDKPIDEYIERSRRSDRRNQ